ncbi:MAG: DUF4395 domain-containing protein [Sulfuricurvum sp.]|nr:DUF4395 domain-containing protein [Sulfuricurvum sp.]
MAQQCPLIFRQVDATVTRINTLFVVSGIIGFLVTHYLVILAFLIIDFCFRLSGQKQLSIINNLSLMLQVKFSLPINMEDAGAKRLAAFFGLGFVIAIGIAQFMGSISVVNIIAGIFLSCAALELFFGYCIACKIYYITKKIFPKGFE